MTCSTSLLQFLIGHGLLRMQAFPAYALGMTGWNVHDFITREPPQVMNDQFMCTILSFFLFNLVLAGNEVTC